MVDWLISLTAPLNTVLFVLGTDAVSWAELLGFVTGGACVWLTVRAHIANFPVGIANSAFFLVLFAAARLWADAALQIVYIILGAVGWWQWLRVRAGQAARAGSSTVRAPRPIRSAGLAELGACLTFVMLGTSALTVLLRSVYDVAPFWDAVTTCLSLVAQWLLNGRKVQTWWFWIAADLVYVPLYGAKRLDLTAVVYALFLGMCVAGLRAWRQDARPARPIDVAVGSAK